MTSRRQERISELLLEELGLLISAELIDPRLEDAMVAVTHVQVSADLHNVRIFVEHAMPSEKSRHVLAALQHAEGFLRRALAENLKLRVVPELTFAIDETERRARHLDELLDMLASQQLSPTPAMTETHEHTG